MLLRFLRVLKHMRKDLKLLSFGALLCLAGGCRNDRPPALGEICLGDGFGGADCSLADHTYRYRYPSDLKNFWMITQSDAAALTSWCYQAPPLLVQGEFIQLEEEVKHNAVTPR